MRKFFTLLSRRVAAATFDTLVVIGLSAGVIWLDDRTSWLWSYDGTHLGMTVTVVAFALVEGCFAVTPGKALLGLRVVCAGGSEATVGQRILRAFIFWILVAAPASTIPFSPFQHFPLPLRSRLIAWVSLVLALSFLPFITALTSRDLVGVHDYLAMTRVRRPTGAQRSRDSQRVSRIGVSESSRMVSCAAASWAVVCLSFLVLDLDHSITAAFDRIFRDLRPSVVESLRDATESAEVREILENAMANSSSYVGPDGDVVLKGRARYFKLAGSKTTVENPFRSEELARRFYNDRLRAELPPDTRWVEIDVFCYQRFGFVGWRTGTKFLVDVEDHWIFPAPRRTKIPARDIESRSSRRAREPGSGGNPRPSSGAISLDRKVDHSGDLIFTGWRFPSVDFVARGDPVGM